MDINYWAVLAAAASSFVLGGLWYGPLFKHAWCREAGIDPQRKPPHQAAIFGGAFVFSLLAAYVFAAFLPAHVSIANAAGVGATVGVCWIATSFGINYLFAQRGLKLWLIDAGYHTLQFTLYGLILGAWR